MSATLKEAGVDAVEVGRDAVIADQIVFVGGQGGCGKTMLTPIVSSFDRMEIQKYNYVIEHICTLHYLGKITDDVATMMIRMLTDLDLYNLLMSREVNFRPGDISSIFKNTRPWRYIKRAFQPGDEATMARIKAEKPILNVIMHDLLMRSKPLFTALGDRMTVIELVRHPLYMIKQWMKNVDQFYGEIRNERDYPRDFSIRYRHDGRLIPWWNHGAEHIYKVKNPMDKLIYALEHHLNKTTEVHQSLTQEEKDRIVWVSFERFVLNPQPDLDRMFKRLGSKAIAATQRELKRQNVPRKRIADGIGLPVYKKYGWKPPEKGSTERTELNNRRSWAAEQASPEAMKVLDRMSAEYEEKWMKEILRGQ